MQHLNSLYFRSYEKLKKEERLFFKFTNEEENELRENFNSVDENILQKIIFLLSYTQSFHPDFEDFLFNQITQENNSPEKIITLLGALQRQTIEKRERTGDPIPARFWEIMQELLNHPSLEVREWSLRLLHLCGSKVRRFLPTFKKIKPSAFVLSLQKRKIRGLIILLEKKLIPASRKE